jgi:hypothetical protein
LPGINKVSGYISNTNRPLIINNQINSNSESNKSLKFYSASGIQFETAGNFISYKGGKWFALGEGGSTLLYGIFNDLTLVLK